MTHYRKILATLIACPMIAGIFVTGAGFLQYADSAEWKPVEGILLSKFADTVDPAAPLPEYPRPQLMRSAWQNLNGLWEYAIAPVDETCPEPQGEILVPFPAESALSGVAKTVGAENNLWYRRTFSVPADWAQQRVLLHFDAVDWRATVWVNEKEVGTHDGGYVPFAFDITDALSNEKNTLVVRVWDPTDEGPQPRGKQVKNPHGIWYTPVTGIWQTVWLEPVSAAHITKILPISDIKTKTMTFTVSTTPEANGMNVTLDGVSAKVSDGKATLTKEYPDAELWSPTTPKLYDVTATLSDANGKVGDTVESYFGMREIRLGKTDDGVTRMMLNGEFVFQHGPLDQGWWPDGLYRAPTDEALRYDVEMTKAFGYNMLRKHVKSEPARFYRHCDELGILVWQDMPSGDRYIGSQDPDYERTPEAKAIFESEYAAMIDALDMFPSIVLWVPFNEGWGQYETCRIVDWTYQLDPTRLVDCASGWTDRGCGSVHDMHNYPGPGMPEPEELRAVVLGEYGGLGLPVKGHSWNETGRNWGYVSFEDKESLFKKYEQLNRAMHPLIDRGLSAAVYTQTTDVEIEVNGLMSYDREIIKVPVDKMFESNQRLHLPAPKTETILPDARSRPATWRFTTEPPVEGWMTTEFNDSAWKEGMGGFGQRAPRAINNTEWNTNDLWLRTTFDVTPEQIARATAWLLTIYHDEDAQLFLNGEEMATFSGYTTDYQLAEIDPAVMKKGLRVGKNLLAVYVSQTTGGQYIDVGLTIEISADDAKKLLGGQRQLPRNRRPRQR